VGWDLVVVAAAGWGLAAVAVAAAGWDWAAAG
jgi:hypothetical protein